MPQEIEKIENWSEEELLRELTFASEIEEADRNQIFAEMLRRIWLKLCDIRVNKGG